MNLLKLSAFLPVLLTAPHFCPTTAFATDPTKAFATDERLPQPQLDSIKEAINRDNSLYQEDFQTARSEGKSASWMELLDLKNVKPDKNADFVYRATLRYHNFVPQSFKTKKVELRNRTTGMLTCRSTSHTPLKVILTKA